MLFWVWRHHYHPFRRRQLLHRLGPHCGLFLPTSARHFVWKHREIKHPEPVNVAKALGSRASKHQDSPKEGKNLEFALHLIKTHANLNFFYRASLEAS